MRADNKDNAPQFCGAPSFYPLAQQKKLLQKPAGWQDTVQDWKSQIIVRRVCRIASGRKGKHALADSSLEKI